MSGPNAALKEKAEEGTGVNPDHEHAEHLVVVDADKGIIGTRDGRPRRKNIAVCGFASSTRHYILDRCARPDWTIVGLNQLYRHIPRADVWADLHWNWNDEVVPGTDHYGWIRDCGIPVLMLKRHPELPTSVRYPIERIIDKLEADYFTSTIAYLTAWAIDEIDQQVHAGWELVQHLHAKRVATGEDLPPLDPLIVMRNLYETHTIGIYGVDLVVGSEYFDEKPCAEFWIGQATARGIRVEIPAESALCKQFARYGYAPPESMTLTAKEVEGHQGALRGERDELLKRLYMLEGAMECDERWKQVIQLRERGAQVVP